MANQKYSNLLALMATGNLNWVVDPINAYLQSGTTYNAANTKLSETGGTLITSMPVPGRMVDDSGLLGDPVSFNRCYKGTEYQVVIAKDTWEGDPLVLAYYDEDSDSEPLMLKNNGTLIVRPVLLGEGAPTLGIWVKI